MSDRFRCWLTERGLGRSEVGGAATLAAAQRLVDQPYRAGYAEVLDDRTGRRWERKRGSWFVAAAVAPATPE